MSLVSHAIYLSLAQRYWDESWSADENRRVYGAEASIEGVGANPRLELEIERESARDEEVLRDALQSLKDDFDHQTLFGSQSWFGPRASTLERMTQALGEKVFIGSGRWRSLSVWETERIRAVVRPGMKEISLHAKFRNLWLEFRGVTDEQTGLLVARHEIQRAVENSFSAFAKPRNLNENEWARELGSQLKSFLPALVGLTVDLGRQPAWSNRPSALRLSVP